MKQNRVTLEESLYMRFLYREQEVSVNELRRRFPDYSRATIFRHVRKDIKRPFDRRKLNKGRPRKLTIRDERNLLRHIKRLRLNVGPFTLRRLAREAGIDERISMATVSRVLRKNGFHYLHSRRKGIMKKKDFTKRLEFAREALNRPKDFWMKDINFYIDGTGFTHKTNPHGEARATKTMAWRKKSEGLDALCTTKGKRAGTGGRMANFMVAISPNKGVVLCHQYFGRLNGGSFSSLVRKTFPKVYKQTQHINGRLFLQDGCPVQNSAAARKAFKRVKAKVFAIPPRSPDLNPIENFFNLINAKLHQDALDNVITSETFEEYSERVKLTIENYDVSEIDKIISSMPDRINAIIKRNGQRLRY